VARFTTKIINIKDDSSGQLVPGYRLFVRDDGVSFVFYPVPKNANSSFKSLVAKHLGVEHFLEFYDDDHSRSNVERYANKPKDKPWLSDLMPSKRKFHDLRFTGVSYRIAVARDPVARFFSAYKNRILWHQDKAFRRCTVEEVIGELERGNFENRHFLPQTYFLGSSPSYYTHLAVMPDLTPALSGIQEFFGKDIALPRLQIRHGELETHVEGREDLKQRLMKIYGADYKFIESAKRSS
jgi:hypothetical protein